MISPRNLDALMISTAATQDDPLSSTNRFLFFSGLQGETDRSLQLSDAETAQKNGRGGSEQKNTRNSKGVIGWRHDPCPKWKG